jgi:hypothetical protein
MNVLVPQTSWRAALFGAVGQDRPEVEHLVDQFGDEPGRVVLGQPVIQRRGQQQDLMWIERPKRLLHRRRQTLRPLLPDRLDLEQSIATMHTMIIPHDDHEPQAGCRLLRHAPRRRRVTRRP